MTPSIRARLTLWYFAVQAMTFAAFGVGIFFAVRGSGSAAQISRIVNLKRRKME